MKTTLHFQGLSSMETHNVSRSFISILVYIITLTRLNLNSICYGTVVNLFQVMPMYNQRKIQLCPKVFCNHHNKSVESPPLLPHTPECIAVSMKSTALGGLRSGPWSHLSLSISTFDTNTKNKCRLQQFSLEAGR